MLNKITMLPYCIAEIVKDSFFFDIYFYADNKIMFNVIDVHLSIHIWNGITLITFYSPLY